MEFKIIKDENGKEKYIETSCYGYTLLNNGRLNKGSLFSKEERDEFELNGLLPCRIPSLEEVLDKCYVALHNNCNDLEKHIYLRALQDRNEVLFYAFVQRHFDELIPLIYTPVVGLACQSFSSIYRRPRGVYVSYTSRDKIEQLFDNKTFDNVEAIVVSDGERILGLGDQGAGGMGIPIGKLSLYTACAGIAPEKTLPIILDVGTNNENLLNDPFYIGCKQRRVGGEEYDNFIELFVNTIKKRFPKVLLQWEDFARNNAGKLLNKYRNSICSFNDDIQGTAAVVVGALASAISVSSVPLIDQRIVIAGAGSAGIGIANFLLNYMERQKIDRETAASQIFMVDRDGLLTSYIKTLDFQKDFIKNNTDLAEWKFANQNNITLLETITNAKATLLIGVSGQGGLFNEQIIKQMVKNTAKPIIFPLSNPDTKAEALPSNIVNWSNNSAIIGVGTYLPSEAKKIGRRIDQVNNYYIFPGIGLGILTVKSKIVTDSMFLLAAEELARIAQKLNKGTNNILPDPNYIQEISKRIAFVVAKEAIEQGLARVNYNSNSDIKEAIEKNFWKPVFLPYKRVYNK